MKRILTLIMVLVSLSALSQKDTSITKCDTSLRFNILAGGQITAGNFNNFGFTTCAELKKVNHRNYWTISPTFRITMQKAAGDSVYRKKELEFYSNQAYERKYDKWKIIVFSEIEHSYLRKVKFRTDFGVGGGYQLIRGKNVFLEITEVILPDVYISDTASRDNFTLRSSTRLKFVVKLDPITISSINLFQPELCGWDFKGYIISAGENINFRSTTSIDVAVRKGVSIGGRLDYIYQTYPHVISEELRSKVKISPYDIIASFYIKYTI